MAILSLPLVGYVCKAAARDKIFYGFVLLLICLVSFSTFMGSGAVVEKGQFVTIYMAYSLRLLAVMALCLFIAFLVRRLHDNKDLEFLLARPILSLQFILSFLLSFGVLSLLLSFLVFVAFLLTPVVAANSALLIWAGTLFFELLIVGAAAFFFALVLPSAVLTIMATLGFYLLCRMLGALLMIIQKHVVGGKWGFLNNIMEGVSILIPRFDLVADSGWLLYGVQNIEYMPWFLAHGCLFMVILVVASYLDLTQKQF
ncbi:MAG: hypothetical protein GC136_11065 [Alphaproteobacteria bacterium]|nr:hypothetical protein [Alphaproteobacteria bacterium]